MTNHSPFTDQETLAIGHWRETQLISQIKQWTHDVGLEAPAGIGDDCAVVPAQTDSRHQLLTTDSVTYGQHFDDSVSAFDAGAKLIKRNVSDIAAMGGTPKYALLALLCSPTVSKLWIESFFEGLKQVCEVYQIKLIGGDVSATKGDSFSSVLTLTGDSEHILPRSTGGTGDAIYVTGTLGGSILGKHYQFTPRLKEAQWLASQPTVNSLMDLTDGLAKDLLSLLPSDHCARLDLENIPVSKDAIELSHRSGKDLLEHVFTDGEDYELLFTISGSTNIVESQWKLTFPDLPLTKIGTVNSSKSEARLVDQSSGEAVAWTQGFEHLDNS